MESDAAHGRCSTPTTIKSAWPGRYATSAAWRPGSPRRHGPGLSAWPQAAAKREDDCCGLVVAIPAAAMDFGPAVAVAMIAAEMIAVVAMPVVGIVGVV